MGGPETPEYRQPVNELYIAGRCLFRFMGLIGCGKTQLIRRTHEVLSGRIQLKVAYRTGKVALKDARYLERLGLPILAVPEGNPTRDLEFELWPSPVDGGAVLLEERMRAPLRLRFGREARVWIQPVILGDAWPERYPGFLKDVDIVVLNHLDLLPFTDFSLSRFKRGLRAARPGVELLSISCRSGLGLEKWREWVLAQLGISPQETGAKK
ncbi:MAG TPA: hydrogenase nickel incorporation protein HypB [Firmicutes bacterium]|jgi:hydrogenase nickel incorporation protein HypB|nr:hydrogenase nickel incorporation protein HypB [Bacillota bacterium]HPT66990.1 hypothetical protein [Bacillota bacterium]